MLNIFESKHFLSIRSKFKKIEKQNCAKFAPIVLRYQSLPSPHYTLYLLRLNLSTNLLPTYPFLTPPMTLFKPLFFKKSTLQRRLRTSTHSPTQAATSWKFPPFSLLDISILLISIVSLILYKRVVRAMCISPQLLRVYREVRYGADDLIQIVTSGASRHTLLSLIES